MTRTWKVTLLSMLLAAATPLPALADATAFIGSTTTPANRRVQGFAAGVGLLIVGFEMDYANTVEDVSSASPGLRTVMGNVLLQTPSSSLQVYLTSGVGGYRERLGDVSETHIGFNSGGGVKVSLLGPIRVRLDYRVFQLRGEPLHSKVHRFYGGINLKF